MTLKMSPSYREEMAAKEKAERLDLSFYVANGYCHVFDGGKRSIEDDETWNRCVEGSYRRATDEEIEMWDLIP